MPGYRAEPSRPDKAKAIAAVALVYGLVAGAVLLMPRDTATRRAENEPTILIDIEHPPEPLPPPQEEEGKVEEEEGAAGKMADHTPVVAPTPRIDVPAATPVPAAPVAGTGAASSAGAASSGTGPGAGGSGSGRGGGGSGGGIGTQARLLGGNSSRLPSSLLRAFAADRGQAQLLLTVAGTGRVTECSVLHGTGSTPVDQALCSIMEQRSRWAAARDRQGRPITVKVRYTATWKKN